MTLVQYLMIAGAVLGLVLLVALAGFLYYCLRRSTAGKKKKKSAGGAKFSMNGHNSNSHHYHNGVVGGAQESLALLPQSPMTSGTATNPLGDFLPPEIPLSSIRFLEELGEGQFGKVWKGELMLGYTAAGEEPMQVGDWIRRRFQLVVEVPWSLSFRT